MLGEVICDLRLDGSEHWIRIQILWWLLLTSKPFPQIWVFKVEHLQEGADVGLVHGVDVLLHPGPQHQVQLQEPPLLAPVHQPVE